ncbi:hypothetical protein CROQUDRAFT_675763 [Cronartium quercuum f. sp. fusiforme G11]|uniref:Uncharacterized protein n=1 Tax=Cronartium quercuum f. sp. fusiforme G11 TaxID=708437 RepID=A0A9P6NYF3_9BASI|nr:hypothetical protein CROQUDRAFT_675763 [Cronartium quercuum f. sp. fusiforme G11]
MDRVFGIKRIENLMDDTWGICTEDEFVTFKGNIMPLDQARFLCLFDILNIPWDWKKQVWDEKLEIIGHHVDANNLSFSLSLRKKHNLITALRTFVSIKQHQLKDWQLLLSWSSWGLIFALQAAWDKTGSKIYRNLFIPTNTKVQGDLQWLASAIEDSMGVYLFDSTFCGPRQADVLVVSNACPKGIGVWFPNSAEEFHHLPPQVRDIYWVKLLSITYALKLAAERGARKIFICITTKKIACRSVRPLFCFIIHLLVTQNIDVRVGHIPGAKNIIVGALSRGELLQVNHLLPNSRVSQIPINPSIPE